MIYLKNRGNRDGFAPGFGRDWDKCGAGLGVETLSFLNHLGSTRFVTAYNCTRDSPVSQWMLLAYLDRIVGRHTQGLHQ
ncbi:MAG: hypothetical protein Ct9H300mP11_20830 [Chloroflexota bacterium]|nr:MAG: hypothetical protein Ct9H300mP11_20830 [Chloroflexota bacterium]